LSRTASFYKSENHVPVKWSSPEVLEYGSYTNKSDVWSFGIMLWEIFSYGDLPYSNCNNDIARLMIIQGKTMNAPPGSPVEIYEVMQKCWTKNPNQRPPFTEIFTEINTLWTTISTSSILIQTEQRENANNLTPLVQTPFKREEIYGKTSTTVQQKQHETIYND